MAVARELHAEADGIAQGVRPTGAVGHDAQPDGPGLLLGREERGEEHRGEDCKDAARMASHVGLLESRDPTPVEGLENDPKGFSHVRPCRPPG